MLLYMQQVVNGVSIGLIYFLIAVGLSIIFGLLRFVNFAHGAFYVLGAYFFYALLEYGVNFYISLLIAPLLVGAIAAAIEFLILRHIYSKPHEFHIVITVGIAFMIQELVTMQWGANGLNVNTPEELTEIIFIGDLFLPSYRLFIICFTAIIALILWMVLEKTRLGSRLRAGSESIEMSNFLGINTNQIFTLVFGLGGALAGLAGALITPVRGLEPVMGLEAIAVAFVIVVVGGLGSFTGALVGSILIGIVQSVMSSIWPEGARLMIYIAMAIVILWRPNGLLGRAA